MFKVFLFVLAIVLLAGDSDNMLYFAVSKVLGLGVWTLFILLILKEEEKCLKKL